MAEREFDARIRWKRDTSANWTSKDPVLLNGEIIIVDTDSGEVRFKIGDGVKTYTQLPFEDEVVRNLINNVSTALTALEVGEVASLRNDVEELKDEKIDSPTSTSPSQALIVDTVDETGKPTGWKTGNVIRYDTVQELTDEQKIQARENIGAQSNKMVVNIVRNDDAWEADHYSKEIYDYIQAGGDVEAIVQSIVYRLVSSHEDYAAFHLVMADPLDSGLFNDKIFYVRESDVLLTDQSFGVMNGATVDADGRFGFVPTPTVGEQDAVLSGDGTWRATATEDDALDLLFEMGVISPISSTDGAIYTTPDGAIYAY